MAEVCRGPGKVHAKSKTEIKKAKIAMGEKVKVWHARRCVVSGESTTEEVHLYRNKCLPRHGVGYRNYSIHRKASPRMLIEVFNCQNVQIT